jgi:hypothetical protein
MLGNVWNTIFWNYSLSLNKNIIYSRDLNFLYSDRPKTWLGQISNGLILEWYNTRGRPEFICTRQPFEYQIKILQSKTV